MAGQAEKKMAKKAATGTAAYFWLSVSSSILFFIFAILGPLWHGTLDWFSGFSLVSFLGTSASLYSAIKHSLEIGVDPE
jgi:hypothetical protein